MSTTSTPSRTLDFRGVLSETKRIIKPNYRNFLSLSVLFLYPILFSLLIYPILPFTYSIATIFILFVFFLSLCAVATITYTTHHGFYGRPIKFTSAIKSLLHSFLPLLATTFISLLIVVLIGIAFALFKGLVIYGIEKFVTRSEIDYNSDSFTGFSSFVVICFGLVLIWLQVNWGLACVVVVVESKWGFEALRRSAYLIRGMKWVSLLFLYLYVSSIGLFAFGNWNWLANSGGFSRWKSWEFVFQTVLAVLGTFFAAMFMLNYVATNTVLYLYCKALHGELAFEIEGGEFAGEYMRLPIEEGKDPDHVDSIIQSGGV